MRNFFLIFILCHFWCNSQKLASDSNYYSETITGKELMELLYVYSSDYFKGRGTGELGQKRACDFLRDYYKSNNIYPAKGTNDYYQPMELLINKKKVKTENVAAVIKGSHFPNEYVILSAHLDHLGTNDNGDVYNGADDDGSGTVALLEIAEAFKIAFDDGKGPKRSLVFLHFTGEEKGLLGSKFYTENPLYPLPSTIADLNIDMIGRINPKRNSNNPNYIYLIGSDKISMELHNISEEINEKYTQLELDYTYNKEDDPNRFYYRSDHYNFAKNNIPVIFYFSGTHEDYHKISDTADKILYSTLEKRTRLIFHTAWELANRGEKIKID